MKYSGTTYGRRLGFLYSAWWVIAAISCTPCIAADAVLPPEGAYVTVNAAGQLTLHGERVRFYGVAGGFPARENWAGDELHRANRETVARLHRLGFNMVRYWRGFGQGESGYVKGDGSAADLIDHFLYECKRQGIRVWNAGMGGSVGKAMPGDVDVVHDPATAAAWREAVGKRGFPLGRHALATVWDERLAALRLERLKRSADHVNQYTGLRWADDPVFAIWELVNEDWWFFNIMRGRHLQLPEFFRRTLYARWNAYLRDRYVDDVSLRAAWAGNLLSFESLESGSVALLPLAYELSGDAQAKSLGVGVGDTVDVGIAMGDFNKRRMADVTRFLLELWIEHKRAEAAAVQSWGKSLSKSPLVWDTGIGWSLQTQFMHQHADAVAHATYMNGTHHPDPTHKRYPWYSALEELPLLAWDKPWLEQNRTPGKPFFVYENNIMQPAKYRGEHPVRMVHLGAIQDWDAIITHYWGFPVDPSESEPYTRPMDYTLGGHPQGYHFQYDSVLQSAMTVLAEVFKHGHIDPAPDPTIFIFGRRSLHDPTDGGYGDATKRIVATAYRYGSRIVIDPEREGDEVRGPSRRRAVYEPSPVRATDEMRYDYQKGALVLDAPGAAVFTGFFAEQEAPFEFASGVAIQNVRMHNDTAIAYPVTDEEQYLTFGVASRDGKPLAETSDAVLTAMSTSFNDGFELDPTHVTREWFLSDESFPNGAGGLPIRYARPEVTLRAGPLRGMRYRILDFHLRTIETGRIDSDTFVIRADMPLFLIELQR